VSLYGWILLAMVHWCPVRWVDTFAEYQVVAAAIDRATQDPDDAALLASIGSYESGFDVRARNPRTGAIGAWQLMSPQPCRRLDVDCQAVEALRRTKVQGMAGYTGEATTLSGEYPLAIERMHRATVWTARNPPPEHAAAKLLDVQP